MPFPFSSTGTLSADLREGLSVSDAVAAIAEAIREEKPSNMNTSTDTVTFSSGIFRLVNSWNQLAPISSGSIRCTQSAEGSLVVHYHISFIQMFVVVSLMVGLIFGIVARAPLPFLLAAWAWLFGVNYALTLYRFPRFLGSALSRATAKTLP